MSKPVDQYLEYVIGDVLNGHPGVSFRKMFGGYALYLNKVIFGIITSDSELYFKVDDSNRALYETMGSHPFVYDGWKDKKRKPLAMPYWLIPEEVMEDCEKIIDLMESSAKISKK
jgi:DNA transformation protein